MKLNHIYTGDNVEILATFPDNSIDLTITSPPYDETSYVNGVLKTFPEKGLRDYEGYTWDFVSVAEQLYRITKPGGVVVWVVGDKTEGGSESGSSFRQALYFKELGFNIHDTMLYQTNKPPLNHNRYEQCFEYMFILSRGKPKTFNPIMVDTNHPGSKPGASFRHQDGSLKPAFHNNPTRKEKIKGNVWLFGSGYNKSTRDNIAFEHPAIFPEQLAKDHIISWSEPGNIVLDPFCGSGTTLKQAIETGRQYIGIDCSHTYVSLSRKRIARARTPLFLI